MTSLANPAAAVLEAYRAAVYAKDADAYAALYDHDVHVFDIWGRWSHVGIDAWKAMAVDWFSSLGSDRDVVTVEDLQTHQSGDLATAHAYLRFAAVSAEGKELRAMFNRVTLILQKRGGAWKIIHQHTSSPIDFATMKVMLDR